jgi:hypothetical protein
MLRAEHPKQLINCLVAGDNIVYGATGFQKK